MHKAPARAVPKIISIGFPALLGAGLAVHLAHTLLGFASPGADFFIEEWIYDFVTAGAAALVVARVVIRRDDRVGWGLIAGALVVWAASDLYWTLEYAELDSPPFPGAVDASYLAGYLLLVLGVGALVRGRVRNMSALVWVDVALAALCVGAIGTTLLMGFVVENTTGTTTEVVVSVAYPVLDLVTLAVAVAALALTGWLPGRALGFVAAGVACTAIGDAVYTHQTLEGTYSSVSWNNSLWPFGVILIAIGALQPAVARRQAPRPESWRSFSSPVIFALAIIVLLLASAGSRGEVETILTSATLAAIVVRLSLTFRENRRLVSELQRDELTGLGNRSKLRVDLERILRDSAGGPPGPHVLTILDLDGFKSYNDSFGHPAGDELLIRLAGRLDEVVAGRGFAYRVGGDEFAVVAPGTSADIEGLLGEAGEALSDHGEGFAISCSVGSAEVPREASRVETAIALADQRMYERKDARRPTPSGEVEAVLVRMIQQHSRELSGHGEAVGRLGRRTAKAMGMPDAEITALVRAAELHDIGKVAIPDEILDKPGPLDEQEWRFMRQHTLFGERILSAAPSLSATGAIVRATHERWDGSGYPDGLSGEAIPIAARIVLVCDAYDAMTSDRPYAPTRSHEGAIAELRAFTGSMFDPAVVEAFCKMVAETAVEVPGETPGEGAAPVETG